MLIPHHQNPPVLGKGHPRTYPPISGIGYRWQLQKNTPFPGFLGKSSRDYGQKIPTFPRKWERACGLLMHSSGGPRQWKKNRVNFHSIFTPWVVTSVITSFGVNIESNGRDSTRWVVNFHSILELEASEIHSSTSEICSLHRWSELFTRLFLESGRGHYRGRGGRSGHDRLTFCKIHVIFCLLVKIFVQLSSVYTCVGYPVPNHRKCWTGLNTTPPPPPRASFRAGVAEEKKSVKTVSPFPSKRL